jgi:phage terminase small subunit
MTEYRPPPAPSCLGAVGKAAWDRLTHVYEFTAGELQLLEQFCATKQLIAELNEALDRDGVMVLGSRNQKTLNPVVNQIAVQRTLLDRLLLSLALPVEYETEGRRRNPQARQAAKTRWDQQVRRKGRLPSIGGAA